MTPPSYGKVLVAVGVGLAVFGASVENMSPTLGFYCVAASSGINAAAAYLGWSPPTATAIPG